MFERHAPPEPSPSPPRIGLSLIVRNGAETLPRLLAPFSREGWEIAAVDTGSTDDTIAILRAHGAVVVERAWRDDFADARNAALALGSAPWVLSVDADEWVDESDLPRLEAATRDPAADACVLETINYVNYADPATTRPTTGADSSIAPHWFLSAKVRLFRRRAGMPEAAVRWEGPVHELVDFSAKRLGYRTVRCPVRILHDGLLRGRNPETYGGRAERAVAEGNAHPGIILVVALRLLKRGDLEGAERLLETAHALEPAFAAPAVWLSRLLAETGRRAEARALLLSALQSTTADVDVLAELIAFSEQEKDGETVRVMRELAVKLHPGHPYWN